MKRIKANFFSGLITILPIIITFYIFNWIFKIFINLLQNSFVTVLIRKLVLTFGVVKGHDVYFYTNILINMISFIVVITTIIVIGTAMRVYFFKEIVLYFETLFIKIPFFSHIYNTITQILEVFSSNKEKAYKKVVMIEYPRKGVYSIGFMTSEESYLLENIVQDEEFCNVFIPTSPNPTSGMFVIISKKDIKILDIKVDDAIKMIISGGVISPPSKKEI